MLSKTLFAAALLAASAGVMADSGPRVYGSVVIADPNFSVAIASAPYYPGYYAWAPPPPRYYYAPKYHYRHKHQHHHHYQDRHDHRWNDRSGRGHGGRP